MATVDVGGKSCVDYPSPYFQSLHFVLPLFVLLYLLQIICFSLNSFCSNITVDVSSLVGDIREVGPETLCFILFLVVSNPQPFRCSSYVGMINDGPQPLTLSEGCRYHGTVVHELGHAIGMTQSPFSYDNSFDSGENYRVRCPLRLNRVLGSDTKGSNDLSFHIWRNFFSSFSFFVHVRGSFPSLDDQIPVLRLKYQP